MDFEIYAEPICDMSEPCSDLEPIAVAERMDRVTALLSVTMSRQRLPMISLASRPSGQSNFVRAISKYL